MSHRLAMFGLIGRMIPRGRRRDGPLHLTPECCEVPICSDDLVAPGRLGLDGADEIAFYRHPGLSSFSGTQAGELDGPRPYGLSFVEAREPRLEFRFGEQSNWRPNPDAAEVHGPESHEGTAVLVDGGKGLTVVPSGEFEDEVTDPEDAAIRIRPVRKSLAWPR